MPESGIRLVVGLGNPGPRYEDTRHNVGFRALDRLVGRLNGDWRNSPVGDGVAAQVHPENADALWAAKPHTYMNESGRMVGPLARYFKIPPQGVLVVSDDMDLPAGSLRIRRKGSSGGQRGLRSILDAFGSQEVPRLRLGVGPKPARFDAGDFVLGRFGKQEAELVEGMIDRAAEAILYILSHGIEAGMNAYNGKAAT